MTASCEFGSNSLPAGSIRSRPRFSRVWRRAAKIGSTSVAPWATAPSHASSTGSSCSTSLGDLADDLVVELLGHALAVVLELGLGAPGEVEVLVALGGGLFEEGDEVLHGGRTVGGLADELVLQEGLDVDLRVGRGGALRDPGVLGVAHLSSPSSSMTSASTTSSSSAPVAPAPLEASASYWPAFSVAVFS